MRTGALEWVANADRTRWFLVLRVADAPEDGAIKDRLRGLLRACNIVVKGIGQPVLYDQDAEVGAMDGGRAAIRPRKRRKEAAPAREDAATTVGDPKSSPCFHISIAWTLDDPRRSSRLRELPDMAMDGSMEIRFSCVKVKIGNVVHDIPLG